MCITIKKPTEMEKNNMKTNPTWECGVSEFFWHYDSEETALITEGEVTIFYNGGNVSFCAGDYVVFPKGLSCVWQVLKPVKKYYHFQ